MKTTQDNFRLLIEAAIIIACIVGTYLNVIPEQVLIAVISAYVGHSFTLTTQSFTIKRMIKINGVQSESKD